jgi:hypothetical protein
MANGLLCAEKSYKTTKKLHIFIKYNDLFKIKLISHNNNNNNNNNKKKKTILFVYLFDI